MDIFFDILKFFNTSFLDIFCGPFLDLESLVVIKNFFNSLGCSNLNYQDNFNMTFDFRFSFLLTSTLDFLSFSNTIFIIGSDLRLESPLINQNYVNFILNERKKLKFIL